MESLKQEAMNIINKNSDSQKADDLFYRQCVIEKVIQGRAAVKRGDVVTSHELRKEIESW